MAITENGNGNGMVMPVAPMYGGGQGGFGFGGDWAWILLLLVLGGGWGGFGMGGFGGMMGMGMMGMDFLYPWLNNSQNINDGFRDQQLSTQVNGIQNAITSGFGDVQLGIAGVNQNICQTGNGITAAINAAQNATAQQLYSNEIASLNRSFAEQTANAQGFNGVHAGLADTKYTIATEECATRSAAAMNARDIIDSQNRGTQAILDKLCALELDGVKSQLAQAQRENVGLQNQVNMATLRESQAAQNAFIAQEINQQNETFYNRLKNCPVNAVPVAGNTPLFTCNPSFNTPNGCNCNGFNG